MLIGGVEGVSRTGKGQEWKKGKRTSKLPAESSFRLIEFRRGG